MPRIARNIIGKGNIIQVNENGRVVIRYRYDGLNRLIREDNAGHGDGGFDSNN